MLWDAGCQERLLLSSAAVLRFVDLSKCTMEKGIPNILYLDDIMITDPTQQYV